MASVVPTTSGPRPAGVTEKAGPDATSVHVDAPLTLPRRKRRRAREDVPTIEKATTKREDGEDFPAAAFAYVPDRDKPSAWKLRLWETRAKKTTRVQVGRALAALGPRGFRGNRVKIPTADLAGVKRRVLRAWRSVHESDDKVPAILKGSAVSVLISDIPIVKSDDEQQIIFGWANLPHPPVAKARNPEGSLEREQEDIRDALDDQFPVDHEAHEYQYVVVTFTDSVIVSRSKDGEEAFFRHAMVREGESIAFGQGVEVEQVYIETVVGKAAMTKARLDDQPPKVDQQDEIVPIDELESAAYEFMLTSRRSGENHEHISGDIVESVVLTPEKWAAMLLDDAGEPVVRGLTKEAVENMPLGWWIGAKVDDGAWAKYKSEDYEMWSIGGDATREPQESS